MSMRKREKIQAVLRKVVIFMKEHKGKLRTALCTALLALVIAAAPSFAWDTREELRRLNKEVPSMDGFAQAHALIWLKDSEFKMLNDGTMETTKRTIIMMGENIPDDWKNMIIPIPEEGKTEIIDASWYNPMTTMKEGSLEVSKETLKGGAEANIIKTPDSAVGRAVVLIVRETHPKRYGIDAAIPMASHYPVWEQNVTAEVPEGLELYRYERDVKEPSVTKELGLKRYKWTVMNQEPWNGEGFVVYKRPELAFSTKKGVVQNLKEMQNLEKSIPSLPIPSAAAKGDKLTRGLRLMQWIAEPSRLLTGYPENWVRPSVQIPEEGPWTPWEQTLLLNRWLVKLGWESSVWWQSVTELDEDSPAALSLWAAPVLEANSGKGKEVLYQAGQMSDFGVTAPAIIGSMIYKLNGDKFVKKSVKPGSPSDHKLSSLWIMDLDDNGTARGTLQLNVTGGWTSLFFGGKIPQKTGLESLIRSRINFALPGMRLTPTSVEPTKTGYKIAFDVVCVPGIVQSGNLLLRLPGGIPARVGEMIGKNSDYTFRFPFTIDQKVRINMPKGYKVVQLPPVKKIGEGSKAVLKESITHWPKKAQLLADSMWIVKSVTVDKDLAGILKEELASSLRWPVLDIPFRK